MLVRVSIFFPGNNNHLERIPEFFPPQYPQHRATVFNQLGDILQVIENQIGAH
jgi:hypothetical protein